MDVVRGRLRVSGRAMYAVAVTNPVQRGVSAGDEFHNAETTCR